MDRLKQEIQNKYKDFSKGLKKVSKHFLENPEAFAVNTAHQIGAQIHVSETTVIRFCFALGYSGFSALQKEVKDQLFTKKSSLFEFHSMKSEMDSGQDFARTMMQKDAEVIRQTADRVHAEDFQRVVDQLAAAESVLVLGLRSSHAMAHWFSFSLELIRDNVRLFRSDVDDLILRMKDMNENCVCVAFSFHRYALETIKIAKEAKRAGVFVVGFTDSEVAPIAEYADVLFTVQLPKKSTLDVTPAVFSMMNAIISGVSVKNASQFKMRMEKYEKLQFQQFFAE